MNDVLVPAWIKEEQAQAELEKAKADAEVQRRITAALLIQTEGAEFWRQLLKELAINTDALPKLGIRGSTSPFVNPQGEQHCRIEVALVGAFPKITYTDLFYMPGGEEIRCHTLEGDTSNFTFCVLTNGSGIGVIPENQMTPVNAEKMAEMIVKRMANKIRRQ